jgi:hypothetical protein
MWGQVERRQKGKKPVGQDASEWFRHPDHGENEQGYEKEVTG